MKKSYDFDSIAEFVIGQYQKGKKEHLTIGLQLSNEDLAQSCTINEHVVSNLQKHDQTIASHCSVCFFSFSFRF